MYFGEEESFPFVRSNSETLMPNNFDRRSRSVLNSSKRIFCSFSFAFSAWDLGNLGPKILSSSDW